MRILFAEDDVDLSRAVTELLKRSGYTVDTVFDGSDALDMAQSEPYDGLILDWMMPGMDGIRVLKALRAAGNHIPCLMLTARETLEDRITGLDAGADDYLPKPFAAGELLARVRAMLRRPAAWQSDILCFGDLSLNRSTMLLSCGSESIRLNTKAFQTIELMMSNPGVVLSAERIMDRVWGWDSDAEINVVWVNLSSLRKKLASIGSAVSITAVRGSGYVLEAGK